MVKHAKAQIAMHSLTIKSEVVSRGVHLWWKHIQFHFSVYSMELFVNGFDAFRVYVITEIKWTYDKSFQACDTNA